MGPSHELVGLVRIELTTSSLSVTRSNRLSYSPYRGTNLHHLARELFGPQRAQIVCNTLPMLDQRFIYVAMAISAYGTFSYIRAILAKGSTVRPHRITWGLWTVEGILAFISELQQHVGVAALTTLMLGLMPGLVLLVTFIAKNGSWEVTTFDFICGALSVLGLIYWLVSNQPLIGLLSFVVADQLAAIPTLRKAWLEPESEQYAPFLMGSIYTGITLLTLQKFTTAGASFPGAICVVDAIVAFLVISKLGNRVRQTKITA